MMIDRQVDINIGQAMNMVFERKKLSFDLDNESHKVDFKNDVIKMFNLIHETRTEILTQLRKQNEQESII